MPGIKIRIACEFVIVRLFKTLTGSMSLCVAVKCGNCLSVCLKKREDFLNFFERNILRRIFGPARERDRRSERERVGCVQ